MTSAVPPTSGPQPGQVTHVHVLFARLFWIAIGPLVLVLAAYEIATTGSGWLTPWDATFAIALVLAVGSRWVEQRSGCATTLTGAAATPADFTRYVRRFVPLGIGVWVLANVLGNHVLH